MFSSHVVALEMKHTYVYLSNALAKGDWMHDRKALH